MCYNLSLTKLLPSAITHISIKRSHCVFMYRQYFMRVSLSNSTHNTLETAAFNGKILKFQVEIDAFPLHIKLDMFTFKWQEIFLHGDRGCVKLFAIFFSSQFSNFQVYKILFYFIATRSLARSICIHPCGMQCG